MSFRTCCCKRLFLTCSLLAMAAVIMLPQAAFAQVEDKNLIFQMEGDARTAPNPICFLPFVQIGNKTNGGPATATPVTVGTNSTDSNGCPTVDPTGAAATWSLITFGGNTDDWSSFLFSNGSFTNKAHSLFVPAFTTDA